jgi:hypothetical protein
MVLYWNLQEHSLQFYLNQQYLGYHVANVVNEYNFYVDIRFKNADKGFVKYIKGSF